ncbi:hypothetical protein JXO52_03975 [bacterium]|nr:hypothetical protein [bacterium]
MKNTRIMRLSKNYKVKLASLVIAILLWLIVVMGNSYLQLTVIPFEIINQPAGYVLSEPIPDGAEVTFIGKGFDLIELHSLPKFIELDMHSADITRTFVMRNDMIRGIPPDLDVQVEHIIGPETVTVSMEPLISKRVPVSRKFIRLEPTEGYIIVGPVQLFPDSIDVSGPSTAVNQIDSVVTEPETYSHLIRDFEGHLRIVPPVWEQITYSRTDVQFSADVQRIHERHIYGVPVEVINIPPSVSGVKADPSVLTLTIHGGVDVVSKITVDDISATIDYQKERYRSQTARAVITIPRDILNFTAKPAFFKLRIER